MRSWRGLLSLPIDAADTLTPMSPREFTPDRSRIDVSRDPTPGVPDHLRPDDEEPSFDISRDPTPGVPDHATPDNDEAPEDDAPDKDRDDE
jgi:hypothetical protein